MLRNKGDEGKKEDVGFRMNLWSTYENHFMLRPCVEVLVNTIFAKGLRVRHSTEGRKLTAVAETHVSRVFLDFGKRVLESFMVQGFVVYTVAPKRKHEFFATPVVVPPTRYHVSLEEDAHYRLNHKVTQLREDAGGGKKKMFFFVHNNFSPLSQRCVSAVAATTKYCSYLEHLELHDIEIQRIHANPPVLTTLKTDAAFDSRDMLGGGIPGLAAQNEHQNQVSARVRSAPGTPELRVSRRRCATKSTSCNTKSKRTSSTC